MPKAGCLRTQLHQQSLSVAFPRGAQGAQFENNLSIILIVQMGKLRPGKRQGCAPGDLGQRWQGITGSSSYEELSHPAKELYNL